MSYLSFSEQLNIAMALGLKCRSKAVETMGRALKWRTVGRGMPVDFWERMALELCNWGGRRWKGKIMELRLMFY